MRLSQKPKLSADMIKLSSSIAVLAKNFLTNGGDFQI